MDGLVRNYNEKIAIEFCNRLIENSTISFNYIYVQKNDFLGNYATKLLNCLKISNNYSSLAEEIIKSILDDCYDENWIQLAKHLEIYTDRKIGSLASIINDLYDSINRIIMEDYEKEEENDNLPISNIFVINKDQSDDFYGVIYILIDTNKDKSLDNIMVYIGQTVQYLKDRFSDHLLNPGNRFLKAAIDRYNKIFEIIDINSEFYRTKDGEFEIRVLKKCISLEELNTTEKSYIADYKSCVLDFYYIKNDLIQPLYGYNVNRGGGNYLYLSGKFHPNYKYINEDNLIRLIKKGFFIKEIAKELEIDIKTIYNKITEFWSYLGINNMKEARKYFGGLIEYKTRYNYYSRSYNHLFKVGKENRFYVPVDEQKIIENIKNGLSSREIASKLNLALRTFYSKLDELWGMNFAKARRIFRIYPKIMDTIKQIEKDFLENLTVNGLSYVEIDAEFLKKLVSLGYTRIQMSDLYEWSEHSMGVFFYLTLKMDYINAKYIYWWKPKIISAMKKGYFLEDLINKPNALILIGSHLTKDVIKNVWSKEYETLNFNFDSLLTHLNQLYYKK